MKLTPHNTEQAARGYVMFELARRGYSVQPTDSRFPSEDLLVISPSGKHFGIDVKGQSTKNFWQIKEQSPSDEIYFALVYVKPEGLPDVYILKSHTLMQLVRGYKERMLANGGKDDGRWGVLWTTPFPYKDKWDSFPK